MRVPRAAKPTPDEAGAHESPASTRRALRDRDFEAILGARIRSARLAVNMSQTALGEALGISFQQIQKYENGKDRVAASTMRALAGALGIDAGSFFAEETPAPSGTVAQVREAQHIGSRVLAIKDPVAIRRIMALVDHLASGQGDGQALAGDIAGKAD